MSDIKIFENNQFGEVRTLKRNDQVLFVAKDVCDSLDIKNTTDAVKRLDDDEVTRLNLGGRVGETNLVNEFGLYNLVLGSRKPEAKKFKRWITHDVIPEIRKTGSYNSQPQIDGKHFALESSKLLMPLMEELQLSASSKMTAIKRIYNEAGIELPFHVQLPDNLLTCTDIARKIGVYSNSGNPHHQAIGAIINELDLKPNEIERTMGSNGKHQYEQDQYYPSVLEKVRGWLTIKGKPERVETSSRNYNIQYLKGGH